MLFLPEDEGDEIRTRRISSEDAKRAEDGSWFIDWKAKEGLDSGARSIRLASFMPMFKTLDANSLPLFIELELNIGGVELEHGEGRIWMDERGRWPLKSLWMKDPGEGEMSVRVVRNPSSSSEVVAWTLDIESRDERIPEWWESKSTTNIAWGPLVVLAALMLLEWNSS